MPKRTVLLFLSLLLILTACVKETIQTDSPNTYQGDTQTPPEKEANPATQGNIHKPQVPIDSKEENTEPTKNPEQMLNDILKELDELEQLMDGTR